MSNLHSARAALEFELNHAKQGLAFYSSRVEKLEDALHRIEEIESTEPGTAKRSQLKGNGKAAGARRGPKPKTANGAKQRRNKANEHPLPKTGGDFWLNLVTEQHQSAADIANSAAASLGLDPQKDKQQIKLLKQRVTPGLNLLVTAQKIKDSGAGRERRFYKG